MKTTGKGSVIRREMSGKTSMLEPCSALKLKWQSILEKTPTSNTSLAFSSVSKHIAKLIMGSSKKKKERSILTLQ